VTGDKNALFTFFVYYEMIILSGVFVTVSNVSFHSDFYQDTSMTRIHLILVTDIQVPRHLNDQSSLYISNIHTGMTLD